MREGGGEIQLLSPSHWPIVISNSIKYWTIRLSHYRPNPNFNAGHSLFRLHSCNMSYWSSSNMPDCHVRDPRIESNFWPLWYTASGMGYTILQNYLGFYPPVGW